jgi:hypothetical protein
MTNAREFMAEMQALIETRRDRLVRAQRRAAAALAECDAIAGEINALEQSMEIFRTDHHLPRPETAIPEGLGAELRRHSPKDMLVEYAKLQHGRLNVQEAATQLAAIGAFKNARNASGNIHAVISRNPGLFRKLRRGEYELTGLQSGSATPIPAPDTAIEELYGIDPPVAPPVPLRPVMNESYLTGRG